MTKTKTTSKAVEFVNEVIISGTIKEIKTCTDKCLKFILDNTKLSPNGKTIHTFVCVNIFDNGKEIGLKSGDTVRVMGEIATSTYKGKFRTDIIAELDNVDLI